MLTIEKIDEVWANYAEFKEQAEQHDFPRLLMFDLRLIPLYEDLHKNWDEHHAEIFMKGMKKVSEYFGFPYPKI